MILESHLLQTCSFLLPLHPFKDDFSFKNLLKNRLLMDPHPWLESLYQNFKWCWSWNMHTSYIQRISTYSKEFLTVNMSLSFGGMLKFSLIKMFSSFYNVTFEKKTIIEKHAQYNYWESWVSTENCFLNLFQNVNSFDKWKVMLILLAFKSAPSTWLIDVAFNIWCTCILLLLYGNTDLNPEEY